MIKLFASIFIIFCSSSSLWSNTLSSQIKEQARLSPDSVRNFVIFIDDERDFSELLMTLWNIAVSKEEPYASWSGRAIHELAANVFPINEYAPGQVQKINDEIDAFLMQKHKRYKETSYLGFLETCISYRTSKKMKIYQESENISQRPVLES